MQGNTLTPGEINALEESGAWLKILASLETELEVIDARMESPDPFNHGRACGERRALRWVMALPEVLRQEAEGKSPYVGVKNEKNR